MGLTENIGYRGHLSALNSIAVRGAIATAIVCLLPLLLTHGTRQNTKTNVSAVLTRGRSLEKLMMLTKFMLFRLVCFDHENDRFGCESEFHAKLGVFRQDV
jgi:hypothetical protein